MAVAACMAFERAFRDGRLSPVLLICPGQAPRARHFGAGGVAIIVRGACLSPLNPLFIAGSLSSIIAATCYISINYYFRSTNMRKTDFG
jgi:hypothetical protein